MSSITSLFDSGGLLPHGYCFTWRPSLLWSLVGADTVIAASYFSIPVAMVAYLRRRPSHELSRLGWLFGAFIFACGTTHVMDVWTIWRPDYALQAVAKTITAAVSFVAALTVWPLIPKALKIPTRAETESMIRSLQAEIAKRRSAEALAADGEQNLAVALSSSEAGFVSTDRDGRVRRVNDVAERLLGWSAAEAAGKSLWDVVVREGRPEAWARLNPVDLTIEEQATIADERQVTLVARDGRRLPVRLKAGLTHRADGEVAGVALIFRDVTAQARAEAEAGRLAAIVESSYDAVISKALDGRIVTWNASAQALFGYAPDEAIGQPVAMLIPDERLDEEDRILASIAEGRHIASFDTVRVHRSGARLDVSVTISPIRDASGRVVGASKIARDVSAQRRAEAALRESERRAGLLESQNRQIQEANRLKSLFLANMSHELRTPLNAIIGFSDLLQTGAVAPDAQQHGEFLGHIGSSGRHLLQLINDVLDLAKVESGKFEFHAEPLELGRLVREVCDVLRTGIDRKTIDLRIEVDASLDRIVLDAGRLKQALYNYLSNAIKFSHEAGTIHVRALPQGPAHFRLEVEDTGIGIAAGDLPALFTEFQQLDAGADRRHQGTGLGLALTRRLVEAQGGSVGVTSVPGRGSVFFLVLNRVHGSDPPKVDPGSADDDRQSRWLVVDAAARTAPIANALEAAGRRVDAASSGAQGTALARSATYDAIMFDLMLPDAPGLQMLADIRAHSLSRWSPVVGLMLSSGADTAGFAVADVLAKPIRTEEVGRALARLRPAGVAGMRVMVVDDDPLALDVMQATLGALGAETLRFAGGREALAALDAALPDALILDLMMPEFDGFAVLAELGRRPAARRVPVLVWTSMLLTDREYAELRQSALSVASKGGGSLELLLSDLRQAEPAAEARRV